MDNRQDSVSIFEILVSVFLVEVCDVGYELLEKFRKNELIQDFAPGFEAVDKMLIKFDQLLQIEQ
jgi:hypothetical protein